jgi:hypothetical protein
MLDTPGCNIHSPNQVRVMGFTGAAATTGNSGCTINSTCAGCWSAAAWTASGRICDAAGAGALGLAATGAGGDACCCCLSPHSQHALVGMRLCCRPIERLCANIVIYLCPLRQTYAGYLLQVAFEAAVGQTAKADGLNHKLMC